MDSLPPPPASLTPASATPVTPARSVSLTPARRTALAIGVPVLLALTAWTGFNVVALVGQGSYQISAPLAVRDGTLSMSVSDADVVLAPGSSARLTGTVRYSLIKPELSMSGNGISSFHCPMPVGVCSLNSTVTVPPGTGVDVSSGTGDLTVDAGAVTGNVTLSSGAGDVTASSLAGRADHLSTGAGDITAYGVTAGDVTARSVAGDITLTFSRAPSSVSVSSGAGDITIVVPPGSTQYDVQASSAVGNVDYAGIPHSPSAKRVITATSDVGDITISEG